MAQELTTTPKSNSILPLVLLILLAIGAFTFYLYLTSPFLFSYFTKRLSSSELATTLSPSPTVSPTPKPNKIPYILPTGVQGYRYSHGDQVKGPRIQTIIYDPLDPKVGDTQKITLTLTSVAPVTDTVLTILSGTKETKLNLTRTSGDALSGTYETSWKVTDTFDTRYAIHFLLNSTGDTYDNYMYIR